MATYSQWDKTKPIHRVTWVCGPEAVLRRDVTEHYISQLSGVSWKTTCWFGEAGESGVWDFLLSSPPDGGRLVVAYRAEQISMTERMAQLIAAISELSYVLFVSSEDDFARVEADGKKTLAPHLAAIQASRNGQLIRCVAPSDEERVLKLVASWWPGAGTNFASQVMHASGGTLEAAYQACEIARRAGLPPKDQGLHLAVQQTPHARFADLVVMGDQTGSTVSARSLTASEARSALGLLSYRLGVLQQLAAYQARGYGTEEIARKGIDRIQQRLLAPYALKYPAERVLKCRQLLALAEDAQRSGARTGVLEAVAALW